MRYEEFSDAWCRALRGSGLPVIGADAQGEEGLDLHSMERRRTVYVEPPAKQDAQPFFVGAKLEWRWDALKTARSRTNEEDVLRELLGRAEAQELDTDQPWLRIDIRLSASLPYGKHQPMPSTKVWAQWAREVIGRLERIEPLLPEETAVEASDGRLEILAWKGEPEIRASCGPDGELRLEQVRISAWQAIQLPRHWDDNERNIDESPESQLESMFRRVGASLLAWMEALDHLR